jgi:5-amino-6-(5-phosphoribosylamino)uracil reductase
MPERPYTMLSCSVSLDGYLGDRTPRLARSNEADFDRVGDVVLLRYALSRRFRDE